MITILQIASLFNATGAGIVMAISGFISRKHPRPFFQRWALSYVWGVGILITEFLVTLIGRPPLLSLFVCSAAIIKIALLTETGRALQGRSLFNRALWPVTGVPILVYLGLTAAGVSYQALIAPLAVGMAGAYIWLGFLTMAPRQAVTITGSKWLGWPLILNGAWIFTYPVYRNTPLFWLGYFVAGLLNIWVGMGMIIALLEETTNELKGKNQELMQLDQMKTNFLSTVSHELRTPLTSIVGYLEFLEDRIGGSLTSQQEAFVGEIKQSSRQLHELVNSLLDSAQIQSGMLRVNREVMDLATSIEQALGPLNVLMDKHALDLEVAVSPTLPKVWADPARVTQVLNNLVGNAIKFTEPGGTIRVAADADDRNVWITVSDTGIGMPDSVLKQLFTPFYQGNSTSTRLHGGTGLGLSIVKSLVEAMGGEMSVRSREGEGSHFSFSLPIAVRDPSETPA